MAGNRGWRKWGWVLVFLAPSLIGLLVFMVGPIAFMLGRIDPNIIEAARDLGAGFALAGAIPAALLISSKDSREHAEAAQRGEVDTAAV